MLPPLLVVLIAIVCSKSVLANEINNNTHTELQTLQDEGRALKEITKFLSGKNSYKIQVLKLLFFQDS